MLWYKAWLETRWRMLMIVGMLFLFLFQLRQHGALPLKIAPVVGFIWPFGSFWLAGSGVRTDSPFRVMKGTQGSMYFTLSLPVTRSRLLVERIVFGLAATIGIIVAACCAASLAFPEIRAQIAMVDGLRYALTVFLCSFGMFGISTMLATFLDQQWQTVSGMMIIFAGRWLFTALGFPSFDFFQAMGEKSPVVTHSLPWAAIWVSLGVGAAGMIAASRIEQARQY